MSGLICLQCERVFKPDPRTAHFQKTCSRQGCRRARTRAKLRRWRKLHRDHVITYRPKVRAWAKAAPDYWQGYRKRNREYVWRDNKRRRLAHRRAKRSKARWETRQRGAANVTTRASISRGKLQNLTVLKSPESAANETLMDRRINGIVDYLLWRDSAANETDMALRVPVGG